MTGCRCAGDGSSVSVGDGTIAQTGDERTILSQATSEA